MYDYSTTHICFPEDHAEYFKRTSKDIVRPSVLYNPPDDNTKGYCEDPHITVLYGIHANRPSFELLDLIKNYPRFVVKLGLISLFRNDEFHVVKADVESPDLHILNAEIKEIMTNTQNFPNYVPHATIAYVQPGTCDHLEGLDTFKGLSFLVNKITFCNQSGEEMHIPLHP